MVNYNFKVIDRKNTNLCNIELQGNSTVSELMKNIIRASENLKKKNFDINRMRLTVGDAKGRALSDKTEVLSTIFKDQLENTLVFKDLGRQISWKLVFLIEYFGPILITLFLVAFQKQIYGESKPYTYN